MGSVAKSQYMDELFLVYEKFVDGRVFLDNARMHSDAFTLRLALGMSGLGGEAGEVVDLLKKYLFHNKPLDRDALVKELGDVLWYYELIRQTAGISWTEIVETNMEKLNARYNSHYGVEDENDNE